MGRTVFAVAQGNALARGFCEAAQPETIVATAQSIAHTTFGETRDNSCETRVASFGSNVESCEPLALMNRGVATRTRSKM